MQKMELPYWWEYGEEKTSVNELNEKRSLIPRGLRVPIWKINFCSRVLRLSELPRCRERLQTAICYLRFRCQATGLDASLSFVSTSRRCPRNRSPCCLSVLPMYNFFVATGLDASLSFVSTSRRCPRNRSPCRLSVLPMYNFFVARGT